MEWVVGLLLIALGTGVAYIRFKKRARTGTRCRRRALPAEALTRCPQYSPPVALTPGHLGSGIELPHIGKAGDITLRVEYSFDGGVTWPHFVEATMPADAKGRNGKSVDHDVRFTWLNPTSARPTHQRHRISSPVEVSTPVYVVEEFKD